jgi:hypothetical protein
MGGTIASAGGYVPAAELYMGTLSYQEKIIHTIIFCRAALSKKIRSFL